MVTWDYSGDEAFFLSAAVVLTATGLWRWFLGPMQIWRGGRGPLHRLAPWATLLATLTILYAVLQTWADPKYVVGHADYTLLFMLGGMAWTMLALWAMSVLGLSVRDDGLERDNAAAMVAICGTTAGLMLAYIFANIGGGESIWETIVPAIAASGMLLILWGIVARVSGAVEAIAIDRDVAAGWRMGGFAVACGAILGRSMAGDFESWGATWSEFVAFGWPVVLVAVVVAVLNIAWRPTPQRPRPAPLALGAVPALVLILLAGFYVMSLGRPVVKPYPPAANMNVPAERDATQR